MPHIMASVESGVADFVATASPEFAKLIEKEGGAKEFSPEAVTKFKTEYAAEDKLLEPEAERVRVMLHELELIHRFPKERPINPSLAVALSTGETFKPHSELQEFANDLEASLAAAPPESTNRAVNGHAPSKFITQTQMRQMVDGIQGAALSAVEKKARLDDLSNKFWTLDIPTIRRSLIADRAAKFQAEMQKINGLIELRTKNGKAHQPQNEADPKTVNEEQPPATASRTPPPSLGASSDRVSTAGGSNVKSTFSRETHDNMMWPS